MATHESINRTRDDDDYTVHEASRYVSQEDHKGGFKVKGNNDNIDSLTPVILLSNMISCYVHPQYSSL